MIEEWKPVVGYEGIYEVSNFGNVKSLKFGKEKILCLCSDRKGYKCILLHKKGAKYMLVHRLVVESFIGIIPKNLQVNHINGIKHDNRVENLEIVTASENMIHNFKFLGIIIRNNIGNKGAKNPLSKKVNQYTKDGEFIKTWDCINDADKNLLISGGNISSCCRGKLKSSGGYVWRFKI